jgi:hypothetical protein
VASLSDEVWGTVNATLWRELPTVGNRLATPSDVADGKAVFSVPVGDEYEPSVPVPMNLPRPAVLKETGKPVFVIQAEQIAGKVAIGYRPLSGGSGLCMLEEVEFLQEPDGRFQREAT